MKRPFLLALVYLVLIALVGLGEAGSVTLVWDPVINATGYEIEQSVDNGATWIVVVPNVPASVCVGTPAQCKVVYVAPDRVQIRFVAKNAMGRTVRYDAGVWHCASCAPPGLSTNVGTQ